MPDTRLLGLIGIAGALTFPSLVALLTAIRWGFLRDRGWHPIRSSDVPYPSVLALGSHGWVQTANFITLGVALLATAAGLWLVLDPRPAIGILLLAAAGIASIALAAPTDGSVSKVRSFPGAVHAASFLALLACSVLAALVIGLGVGDVPGWDDLAVPSVAVAAGLIVLTIASFTLPAVGGLASLLLELLMVGWLAVIALRLAMPHSEPGLAWVA